MASTLKTRFRGLNTDLPATKLASGTAREALNVTLVDGKLAKRAGFGEFEDDAGGSSTGIVGIWVAHFKADTYVIVKLTTGTLWHRKRGEASFTQITTTHTHVGTEPGFAFMWADRFIYGDSGGVSQWNPAVGSGVMLRAGLPTPTPINLAAAANGCKDGFYHCHFSYYNNILDVEGVVSGPCKAAGGPAETRIADSEGGIAFASAVPAATGYEATHSRVYTTMGNTEVVQSGGIQREEFTYRAALDVELAIAAGAPGTPGMNKGDQALDWSNTFHNKGGLPPAARIGCWSGAVAVYAGDSGSKGSLSLNSGEVLLQAQAAGIAANQYSVVITVRTPADTSKTPIITTGTNGVGGLKVTIEVNNGAGTANDTTNQDVVDALAANATCLAAFDASTAAGGTYFTTAAAEDFFTGGVETSQDWVYYSDFGRPTMVPRLITYNQTAVGDDSTSWTDSRTIVPRGGHHLLPSPCDGAVVECVAAGGTIVLYTANSTWVMRSTPNGRLYAVKRDGGNGCVGHPAAAQFGFEAHAMAVRAWTVTTAGGFEDISQNAWTTTLEDIPVAQQSDARMAAFVNKDQIWCAVTKSGETTPRRILVLDASSGGRELMVYELAADAWEASEYITGMVEYAAAGAETTMLVATNHGRIFQYPDAAGLAGDGPTASKVDFPATWRGVFGTERSAFSQKVEIAEIHAGNNCSGRVRWTVKQVRANGETSPSDSGYLPTDNAIGTCGLASKTDARYYEVELNSPAVGSAGTPTTWSVYDIILRLTRVGPT